MLYAHEPSSGTSAAGKHLHQAPDHHTRRRGDSVCDHGRQAWVGACKSAELAENPIHR